MGIEARECVTSLARQLNAGLQQIDGLCAPQSLGEERQSEAYQRLAKLLDDSLVELSNLNLWGESNRLLSSLLWNPNSHFLSRGWLQNRARTKPRGYAGDHELLNRIYENQRTNEPLGGLFDLYFQAQAAPQAVRNRMAMVTNWMVERLVTSPPTPSPRHVKIACFGSASGSEIRAACQRLDATHRDRLHVVLVDIDPGAVAAATSQLRSLLGPHQLATLTTNLFRLPQRPSSLPELAGCDLLFCPGLFDYLSQVDATAMLQALYARLNDGGRLIVFQFAPHNPTRAYMEWFGNWYLTYRTASDFEHLVNNACLPGATIEFSAEPLGIDLFASIHRKAT